MHLVTRLAVSTLIASAGGLATSGSADAAGAQHFTFVEEFDETYAIPADENSCAAADGVLHEVRHGTYDITAAPGGQVAGELHVNGAVDGYVELDPDGSGPLPTYTGTYREKANVIVVSENDDTRVAQYRLRTRASAPDGSTLLLVLSGKLTVSAQGVTTVSRDVGSCTIS